jgi:hypothetical protein
MAEERLPHGETGKRNGDIYRAWLKGDSYDKVGEDFSLDYYTVRRIIERANKRAKLAAQHKGDKNGIL